MDIQQRLLRAQYVNGGRKKRAFGHICQSGKVWRARFIIGRDDAGKPIFHSKSFPTKAAAERYMNVVRRGLIAPEIPAPRTPHAGTPNRELKGRFAK